MYVLPTRGFVNVFIEQVGLKKQNKTKQNECLTHAVSLAMFPRKRVLFMMSVPVKRIEPAPVWPITKKTKVGKIMGEDGPT